MLAPSRNESYRECREHLRFYATDPVIRDAIIVPSVAKPCICMALGFILMGERANLRD